MLHFLSNLIHPLAVLLLATWVFFLFSLIWAGAPTVYGNARSGQREGLDALIPFIAFLVVAVVAFIAWAFQVFSS